MRRLSRKAHGDASTRLAHCACAAKRHATLQKKDESRQRIQRFRRHALRESQRHGELDTRGHVADRSRTLRERFANASRTVANVNAHIFGHVPTPRPPTSKRDPSTRGCSNGAGASLGGGGGGSGVRKVWACFLSPKSCTQRKHNGYLADILATGSTGRMLLTILRRGRAGGHGKEHRHFLGGSFI